MSSERQLERESELLEQLKQATLDQIKKQVPQGIGPRYCECGEEIPEGRRWGGYQNCIECAFDQERLDKQYRR